jgi:hypothetical protein
MLGGCKENGKMDLEVGNFWRNLRERDFVGIPL